MKNFLGQLKVAPQSDWDLLLVQRKVSASCLSYHQEQRHGVLEGLQKTKQSIINFINNYIDNTQFNQYIAKSYN